MRSSATINRLSQSQWRGSRGSSPASARPTSLSHLLVAGLSAVAAAALLVQAPVVLLIPLLASLLLGAFYRPVPTLIGCVIATSLYQGTYLLLRVSISGFPVAVYDFFPLVVLTAGLGLWATSRRSPIAISPGLVAVVVLMTLGLVLGVAIGWGNAADSYQLLRVVRVETGLVLALVAALIAGRDRRWQHAVYIGLLAAGIVVAVQTVGSFGWALTTGTSLWSALGLPTNVDVTTGEIARGNVNVLRTPQLYSYLMLPALCVGLAGGKRYSGALVALIVVAAFLTLSRGFWVGTTVCIATVIGYQILTGRASLARFLPAVVMTAIGVTLVFVVAGDAIETRLGQTVTLRTSYQSDISAALRLAESQAAWTALTSSPIELIGGVGAGVITPHSGLARSNVTPLLENSLLGRWTNLTLLSLVGTFALLLGATVAGVRMARDARLDPTYRLLGVMALSLPALIVGSLANQILLSPIAALPFWLLAATVLAASGVSRASGR